MPERENHTEVLDVPESQLISRGFIEDALAVPENSEDPYKLCVWIDDHIQGELRDKVETTRERDMISYLIYRYSLKHAQEETLSDPEVRRTRNSARNHQVNNVVPPEPGYPNDLYKRLTIEVACVLSGAGLKDEMEVIDYMFEQAGSIGVPAGVIVIPAQT